MFDFPISGAFSETSYVKLVSKETGKKIDIPACFICKVQGGKIIRFRAYHNTALWLEVVGMPMRKAA